MTIETSISYRVVENSKYYLHLVHHRLVPEKRFKGHCHRSKLNSWCWQNGYIPDTSKVSGIWMSFVPGTHFYRQIQNTRNWRQNRFLPLLTLECTIQRSHFKWQVEFPSFDMALTSVAITSNALEVVLSHALTTERDEIMKLLLNCICAFRPRVD